jgi:regulatory protein
MNAKDYALFLLGRRAYTEKMLRAKLAYKKYPKKEIEAVIVLCKKYSYINDYDYGKNFILSRDGASPRGHYLLAQELKQKGIEKETIAQIFQDEALASRSEIALARKLIRQKLPRYATMERRVARQKCYGLLARRGFNPEIIRSVINENFRQS